MATTAFDFERCPFCSAGIDPTGAGFVAHLGDAPACADEFERWRDGVGDDLADGLLG